MLNNGLSQLVLDMMPYPLLFGGFALRARTDRELSARYWGDIVRAGSERRRSDCDYKASIPSWYWDFCQNTRTNPTSERCPDL